MARPEFWLALLLLLVAAYLRLVHLGSLGLYGDEDISAVAVSSFLRDGFPHMPSGLVYVRGIPYTAAAAACAVFLGNIETASRLPSAVAGVLAVGLLYGLGRDLIGRGPAFFAAWLLALSSWHVDMSREGRMYSMFLTAFLFSVWCFDRWIRGQRTLDRVGALIGGCLTVLLHELGVLVFFVWALLLYGRQARRETIRAAALMALACALVWIGYMTEWHLGVKAFESSGPSHATESRPGLFALVQAMFHLRHHPTFLLLRAAWEEIRWLYLALGVASLGATLFWSWREGGGSLARIARSIGLGYLIVTAALGLFGLESAALFAFVVLLPRRARDAARSRAVRRGIGLAAAWLAGWILWSGLGAILPGSAERWRAIGGVGHLVLDLFGYPAPHALVYVEAMPVMTCLVALGSAWLIARRLASSASPPIQMLFPAWMWLPLLVTGFTTRWIALRYALPTYPAFLELYALAVLSAIAPLANGVARRTRSVAAGRAIPWMFGLLLLVVPIANEGHGIVPAWRTAMLRYGDSIDPAIHGYPFHPDHRSAGLWVRDHLRAGDVVVAADEMVQTVYVGRVDYWLRGESDARYFTYKRGGSVRSIYTNAPVLERVEDLRAVIGRAGTGRVWVITSGELTGRLDALNPPGLDRFLEAHERERVFTASDGVTRVYRLPAAAGD